MLHGSHFKNRVSLGDAPAHELTHQAATFRVGCLDDMEGEVQSHGRRTVAVYEMGEVVAHIRFIHPAYMHARNLLKIARAIETLSAEIEASAITPDTMPEGVLITVVWKRADVFEVLAKKGEDLVGVVLAVGSDKGCHGAYSIGWSQTKIRGLGPMLYDIAMETAGEKGLMADRGSVSPSARRVWDYYDRSRSDVDPVQLDSLQDTLTPGVEVDNCDVGLAEKDRGPDKWTDSPLSKVYRKRGTPTINRLKRLGLITI